MIKHENIRLGVSACLLGEKVRYDGGHKHDRYLTGTLQRFFEFVPVCPEFECGLGIPRESMRLSGDPASPRLVTIRTGQDLTERMENWARTRVKELEKEQLCGFIFKSKSPSSGMERVKVYSEHGMPKKVGVGIFARIFMEHFPDLPVEEEGRLHDPDIRENFIERVFALQLWRASIAANPTALALSEFQARMKLLLMAHCPQGMRELGRLAARGKTSPIEATVQAYEQKLMPVLKLKATTRKNTNVLQHAMGYFKKLISADEKAEMQEVIGQYHGGLVPLIVPITLIRHFARKYQVKYLLQQTYFDPHPAELQLRNHC